MSILTMFNKKNFDRLFFSFRVYQCIFLNQNNPKVIRATKWLQ